MIACDSNMIRKIRFYNFRGIRKGELELSPLTILIGANGSGKTTVLEALLLTHGTKPLYNKNTFQILSELHQTLNSQGLLHLIYRYGSKTNIGSIELEENNTITSIILKSEKRMLSIFIQERKMNKNKSRSERTDYRFDIDVDIVDIIDVGINELLEPPAKPVAELDKYSLKGKIVSEYSLHNVLFIRDNIISDAYKFINGNWIELSGSGLTAKVAKSLSEIVSLDLTDILNEPFGGGSYALMVRLSDGSRIRLGDLGEGIQLLIIFSLLVEYMNPDLILWDDIEAL